MKINYSGGTIDPEEVIKFIAFTGQWLSLLPEVIKYREVIKKAQELRITASDEQLQEFADQYRTVRGLYSSGEMLNFLKNNGLTEDDFETFCEASVLTIALKNHLATERKIEEYFVNNRAEFDQARISMISVKEKALADEILVQIAEEGEDFHKLARKHSTDEATKYSGGYLGRVSRRMLSPDISAKVFNGKPGDVMGPFEQENLFLLILIEEVIKAELTDNLKEEIKERIFMEWASQFLKEGITINP